MKFAGTVLYVPDVKATLGFYERAFGLKTAFLSENASFGALDTAPVFLGFASLEMANSNWKGGVQRTRPEGTPSAFEVWLATEDVQDAYDLAIKAGCSPLAAPEKKPWGQIVAFVRDADGHVVELSTPWKP